jgi:hypothetical protein
MSLLKVFVLREHFLEKAVGSNNSRASLAIPSV